MPPEDICGACSNCKRATGLTRQDNPQDDAAADLDLHLGYQVAANEALLGLPAYLDWRVTVPSEIASLDLALSYVDTDLSKEQCFGGRNLSEARAVFSATKEL